MKPLEPLEALDSTFDPVIRRYSFRITDGSSTMGSSALSEEGRPSATLGVALGSAAAGASPGEGEAALPRRHTPPGSCETRFEISGADVD